MVLLNINKFNKNNKALLSPCCLLFLCVLNILFVSSLYAADVKGVKIVPSKNVTKVLIDLDQTPAHRVFLLKDPNRVVIDISKSRMNAFSKNILPQGSGVISRIRHGQRGEDLRLVADIKDIVKASSQVINKKGQEHIKRLVIELEHAQQSKVSTTETLTATTTRPKVRDLVVAIDAGHGGVDPGSIGPRGTQEKKVVDAIARKLAAKINAETGMQAYLVRDVDKKVPYHQRIKRARDQNADMFISVHADSFRDSSVTGSSVYVLSQRGASSNSAKWLANKLNADDLVGGVTLKDKDDVLASVLLDLSQSATIAASTRLGQEMLDELASIGRVRKKEVQYANFAVLKSPDVPSILVETGYISNPDEERKLKNPQHQDKIATALLKGVKSYFTNNPPSHSVFAHPKVDDVNEYIVSNTQTSTTTLPTTKPQLKEKIAAPAASETNTSATNARVSVASNASTNTSTKTYKDYVLKPHKIRSGESLSFVSAKYNVTIKALMQINNLKSKSLRIGQVLQIPISSS